MGVEQVGQVGVMGRGGRGHALPDVCLRGLPWRHADPVGTTFPTFPSTFSTAFPLPTPRFLQVLLVVVQLVQRVASLRMLR